MARGKGRDYLPSRDLLTPEEISRERSKEKLGERNQKKRELGSNCEFPDHEHAVSPRKRFLNASASMPSFLNKLAWRRTRGVIGSAFKVKRENGVSPAIWEGEEFVPGDETHFFHTILS
jgi:hypothetical protein